MLSRSTTIRTALAAGGVATLLAVATPVAFASSAVADTEKRGTCSDGQARYDYEVEKDDGRFEINFEVDSNVRGQQWRVRLFHDGKRFYSGVRTTDRDGEVEVERDRGNTKGKDRFRARAVNLGTGEVCKVKIVRT